MGSLANDLRVIHIGISSHYLKICCNHIYLLLILINDWISLIGQVNHTDMTYKKMGLVGSLKIVSCMGHANNVACSEQTQVGCTSNSL